MHFMLIGYLSAMQFECILYNQVYDALILILKPAASDLLPLIIRLRALHCVWARRRSGPVTKHRQARVTE